MDHIWTTIRYLRLESDVCKKNIQLTEIQRTMANMQKAKENEIEKIKWGMKRQIKRRDRKIIKIKKKFREKLKKMEQETIKMGKELRRLRMEARTEKKWKREENGGGHGHWGACACNPST